MHCSLAKNLLTTRSKEGAKFLVVDPDQNGKLMVHRTLTAEEAREAEQALFGNKANTKQYKATTGNMVNFQN